MPEALTTYFGSDQPRITVEVSLPWETLGISAPPPSRQLRMELAATAWHRSRWMSWKGLPAAAMQDPAQWRLVGLGGRLTQDVKSQEPHFGRLELGLLSASDLFQAYYVGSSMYPSRS